MCIQVCLVWTGFRDGNKGSGAKCCFCCWCCCLSAWVVNRYQHWEHGRSPMKNLTLPSPMRFCYMSYIYIYTRDTYSHCFLRLRTLPATSQRSWWLGLNGMSGAVSSTLAASRRALCWWKCSVVFFSPWSGSQAIFVACLRRGRFAISFFFVCAALFLFFLIFSSKKLVPMVTPQDWLKGTRWDGMPYHVTLGPTQGCMLLT